MTIVLTGGGQDHSNAEEWKLRWKRTWPPEPPLRWWDCVLYALIGGVTLWMLLR